MTKIMKILHKFNQKDQIRKTKMVEVIMYEKGKRQNNMLACLHSSKSHLVGISPYIATNLV